MTERLEDDLERQQIFVRPGLPLEMFTPRTGRKGPTYIRLRGGNVSIWKQLFGESQKDAWTRPINGCESMRNRAHDS